MPKPAGLLVSGGAQGSFLPRAVGLFCWLLHLGAASLASSSPVYDPYDPFSIVAGGAVSFIAFGLAPLFRAPVPMWSALAFALSPVGLLVIRFLAARSIPSPAVLTAFILLSVVSIAVLFQVVRQVGIAASLPVSPLFCLVPAAALLLESTIYTFSRLVMSRLTLLVGIHLTFIVLVWLWAVLSLVQSVSWKRK